MVIAEFTLVPVGKGESLSPYVARISRIIRKSGLRNQLTPMSTIVEGNWDNVFGLIRACTRALEKDCRRISLSIKVDIRKGSKYRMDRKVKVVESLLAKGR